AYNAGSSAGLGASSSTTSTAGTTAGQTVLTNTQSFGTTPLSKDVETDNAFDGQVSDENQSIGSVDEKDSSTATDAYGHSTADSLSGGAHSGATYDFSQTWFGPVSVTESD